MSDDPKEAFISRWSRLKAEARQAQPENRPAPVLADDAPPELPPIDKLTLDSDFRGFFHPKVSEEMRRAALRKLFSDPHFNVMDGLDVYIDDYSKSEPIPAAMLASLRQAQRIIEWASGKEEEEEERVAALEADTKHDALQDSANAAPRSFADRGAGQPAEQVEGPARDTSSKSE